MRCHCGCFDLSTESWIVVGHECHIAKHCGAFGQLECTYVAPSSKLFLTVHWRDGNRKTITEQISP